MTPALRPMNLGEILDRTFQIYRSRFLAFVAIAAIPAFSMRLVHIADVAWLHTNSFVDSGWRPAETLWGIIIGAGFYHISSFLSLLLLPAEVKLASCVIHNETASLRSSLKFAVAGWPGFLWVACLKLLAGLLIPDLVAIGFIAAEIAIPEFGNALENFHGFASLPLIAVPGLIGVALFLWLLPRLSLAMAAAALEGLKGFKNLRRSWRLSDGTRGRILLTWVAVALLSWIGQSGGLYVLHLVVTFFVRDLHLTFVTRVLYLPAAYLLTTAVVAVVGPIGPIAVTLFYYDQRIRHEGYDIEQMMAAAGLNPTAFPSADAPAAPAVPQEGPA